MKKTLLLITGLFLTSILVSIAKSEQGYEAANWIGLGYIVETKVVSVSTNTATQILAADKNRADVRCQNTSSDYKVYIGSNTTTLATIGYEVDKATDTGISDEFPVRGALVGELYGLGEGNDSVATVDVKCIEFLVE